jgi:transposase
MALDVEFAELAAPLLAMLEHLEPQIVEVEKRLETECAKEPAHQLLKTAPGVGSVVAGAFISVIDKPTRFQHAHQVEAYLGLVPSENTSGKRRLGSITKQGNSYLRSVLVQGAWAILRQRGGTDPLKLWADAVKNRRGKRIAVVAVARRLAGILWAMWRDKTVYEPGRLGIRGAEELERHAQLLSVRAVALRRAAKKHFHSTTREMSA